MTIWVEVIEPGLDVGDHAVPVVEQQHGVVFFSDCNAAFIPYGPLRRDNTQHGADVFYRAKQAREGREIVNTEIRHGAAKVFVKKRRPIRPVVAVIGMSSSYAPQFARS